MLNIEKYKNEIMNGSHADLACDINVDVMNLPCGSNCKECKKSVVKWLLSEYKEQILDDVEKKYLSEVIKPFRKNVINICKFYYESNKRYISIQVRHESGYSDYVNLPNFNADTMYKGMEVEKSYTLEELDL